MTVATSEVPRLRRGTLRRTIGRQSRTFFQCVEEIVKYTNQASLRCRGGVFRTASRGYGYYRGVGSQSTAWDYSQVVTNPCG
jgi:hypothetical protein